MGSSIAPETTAGRRARPSRELYASPGRHVRSSLAVAASVMALLLASHVAIGASPAIESDGPAGAFVDAPALPSARNGHESIELADRRVLVVGGGDDELRAHLSVWAPATSTWMDAGSLVQPRRVPAVTGLPDGRVLIAGGLDDKGMALGSAEVWGPAADSTNAIGSALDARGVHTATSLSDGRVLLVGGLTIDRETGGLITLSTAELWDPGRDSVERTAGLSNARYGHSATLLPDGRVVVVGGVDIDEQGARWPTDVEVWDPMTESFSTLASLPGTLINHSATLGTDGRIQIIGGVSDEGRSISHAVLALDTGSGDVEQVGRLLTGRASHTTTLLPDGSMLVVGGDGVSGPLASAELWLPTSAMAIDAGALANARSEHTAASLPDGRVMVIGGFTGTTATASVEVWQPDDRE